MAIFGRGKTVYYPGNTLTKFFPELILNWKSLLSDFGIQFEIMEDLNPGWPLWDQGYEQEFQAHAEKLVEKVKQRNIKRIITNSPEAACMFKKLFPEVQTQHVTEVVHENLPKVQPFNSGDACFHDNTTQTRRNNLVNEIREILLQSGFNLKEFDEKGINTQCLGTSTGLINNSPRLAAKLAMRRVRKAPTKVIITDSPEDYLHLRKSTSYTIMELSEVLVEI